MAQCMESWLLADRDAIKAFFGQGFNEASLPAISREPEKINKVEVYEALKKATKSCKPKGAYSKGAHSFELLALVAPEKVMSASPWQTALSKPCRHVR